MKIAYCSDIHLEFGDITLQNTENADVLVLAGDVCVARDLLPIMHKDANGTEMFIGYKDMRFRIRNFFKDVAGKFPQVVYIMGNHEHYNGDFSKTVEIIQQMLIDEDIHNVNFLDKQAVDIDGVTFFGGTMWTDMHKGCPIVLQQVEYRMNDFQCVYKSDKPGRFIPEDAAKDHAEFMKAATAAIEGKDKVVMVSHHAPTFKSINPKYAGEIIMNHAYASDLSEFILDHPQIDMWIHGHMHHKQQYLVGETWVACNPRGYDGYEHIAAGFQLEHLEVYTE